MRWPAFTLVLVLLAGCTRAPPLPIDRADPLVPAAELPRTIDPHAPPPVTPRYDGPLPQHRCFIHSVFAWGAGTFNVPNADSLVPAHSDNWSRANVTLTLASSEGSSIVFHATPFADLRNLTYQIDQPDIDFLANISYAHWYPWNVTGRVESADPALRNVPLFADEKTALSGWLLKYRGRDDKLYAYLDGQLLNDTVIAPHVPLPGGDLYVNGRGLCGG